MEFHDFTTDDGGVTPKVEEAIPVPCPALTLRSAHIKMFVSEVRVLPDEIVISGPLSALKNGVAVGLPVKKGVVPVFGRKWCRLQDSNL